MAIFPPQVDARVAGPLAVMIAHEMPDAQGGCWMTLRIEAGKKIIRDAGSQSFFQGYAVCPV